MGYLRPVEKTQIAAGGKIVDGVAPQVGPMEHRPIYGQSTLEVMKVCCFFLSLPQKAMGYRDSYWAVAVEQHSSLRQCHFSVPRCLGPWHGIRWISWNTEIEPRKERGQPVITAVLRSPCLLDWAERRTGSPKALSSQIWDVLPPTCEDTC